MPDSLRGVFAQFVLQIDEAYLPFTLVSLCASICCSDTDNCINLSLLAKKHSIPQKLLLQNTTLYIQRGLVLCKRPNNM